MLRRRRIFQESSDNSATCRKNAMRKLPRNGPICCFRSSVFFLQSESDSELSSLAPLPFAQEKLVVGRVYPQEGNVLFLLALPPIQGRSECRLTWSEEWHSRSPHGCLRGPPVVCFYGQRWVLLIVKNNGGGACGMSH